jgi:hypothetical protein
MTAIEMVRQVLLTDTSPAHPAPLAPEQRRRQIRELFLPRPVFIGIKVFWDVDIRSLVDGYQGFGETSFLYIQGRRAIRLS